MFGTKAMLTAATGAALLLGASAHAELIYDSNGFESPTFTTGNLEGQDGWVNVLGSGTITIQTATKHDGSQAMHITANGTRDIPRYTLPAAESRDHTVDFWIMPPDASGLDNEAFRLRLHSTGGSVVAQVGFHSDGTMRYAPTVNFNFNQWNHILVHVHPSAGTYGLEVNGVQAYTSKAMLDSTHDVIDVGIDWNPTAPSGGDGAFVDDFRILVPEPATLALLGLGGLAMLGRGRRRTFSR